MADNFVFSAAICCRRPVHSAKKGVDWYKILNSELNSPFRKFNGTLDKHCLTKSEYSRQLHYFLYDVAPTAAPANTSTIELGTSVIDMFYYTPIMFAKRLATLDILSQGRMVCGLGLGWSKDEYQASNIPFMNRGERADEFIQLLKKI